MKNIAIINNNNINLLNDSIQFLSENTKRAYKSDLYTFIAIVNKEIQKTTMKDLYYYFSELENRNYRNSTINRKINSLSKIFTIYETAGLINDNLIRKIKEIKKITRETDKKVITNLTKDDITKVIDCANKKTSLIIRILVNTGLRISELINIKNKDIDNFDGYKKIRINGKANKERYVFISNELYRKIKKVFNRDCEFLFHSKSRRKLTRQILYKQITNAFRKHTDKKVHPHSLRHFFATYKINDEKLDIKAVSSYLGHSTTSITLNMYVHTSLKPEETAIVS